MQVQVARQLLVARAGVERVRELGWARVLEQEAVVKQRVLAAALQVVELAQARVLEAVEQEWAVVESGQEAVELALGEAAVLAPALA